MKLGEKVRNNIIECIFDYYNNVFKELQKTVELLVEFSGEDCIPVSY